MATKLQPAARSILCSPPTNPFTGIYTAAKQRHVFLFAVSFAAILSEFLPVLLSNVPFSLTQTRSAAAVCAVASVVFLGLTTAVLVASFFVVRWPPMPVDPRSIAGVMYYVSRSRMLHDFGCGVSMLNGRQRHRRVREMGRRYFYGVLAGGSWRRLGIDCDLGPGDEVVTAYDPRGQGGGGGRNGNGEPLGRIDEEDDQCPGLFEQQQQSASMALGNEVSRG